MALGHNRELCFIAEPATATSVDHVQAADRPTVPDNVHGYNTVHIDVDRASGLPNASIPQGGPARMRTVISSLSSHKELLSSFHEAARAFETAWLINDLENASKQLAYIESEFGLSAWLLEAKLAYLQKTEGLDGQKAYFRIIREAIPRTPMASFAYYVSLRNEDAVSFPRFSQRLETVLQHPKTPEDIATFFRIRLVKPNLATYEVKALSMYLGVASGVSLIDAYDAAKDVIESVVLMEEAGPYKEAISALLDCLPTKDIRIQNLRHALAGYSTLEPQLSPSENLYIAGEFTKARASALERFKGSYQNIDELYLYVCSSIAASVDLDDALPNLPTIFRDFLVSARKREEGLSHVISDATKTLTNLSFLGCARAVLGYVRLETAIERNPTSDRAAIHFSSPSVQARHLYLLPGGLSAKLAWRLADQPSNATASKLIERSLTDNPAEPELPQLAEFLALGCIATGDLTNALVYSRELLESTDGIWKRRGAQFEVACLIWLGRDDDAVRSVARHCSRHDGLRYVMPLDKILKNVSWRDVRHLKADISLPVAVDVVLRTVGDSNLVRIRRFAYDEFLRAQSVQRPSQLFEKKNGYDSAALRYFFERLCIPEVMDVSFQTFKGSREILEERIQVCSALIDLDPARQSAYAEEIQDISRFINVQEGLQDVDSSRVHVNTDALFKWADTELSESFARYKSLLRSNTISEAEGDLEAALQDSLTGKGSSLEKYLQFPTDELGSLLLENFQVLRKEYLLNDDFGLNAFLSMRVRHGSLSGHIRGPLEERNLLAVRDKDTGIYNALIGGSVEAFGLTGHDIDGFGKCIRDFSSVYDGIIDDLAKHRLQVRTQERPDGMFVLNIAPIMVYWVRSRIHENSTFREDFEAYLSALSVLLSYDLANIREYIGSTTKIKIEEAINDLRRSLERSLSPAGYSKVASEISWAIPEVTAAVDRVSDWFSPDQARQAASGKTMEQIVDVAVEATRAARRGFNPKIERDIDSLGIHSTDVLLECTDILFTILDNVYRHSGVADDPWIRISVKGTDVGEPSKVKVFIRVESEVAAGVFNAYEQGKLDRIRHMMDTGDYRKKVNLEGGTGLLKLKRVVSLDSRRTLEFGFKDETTFFVEVSIMIVYLKAEKAKNRGL
ncbi:hypothetical protein [Microvirga sp. M2]|uniref:hypothetical protein n=1 Tax=Microvirga sp. M2 TaxID=3073270 RepID=UPI0039C25C13